MLFDYALGDFNVVLGVLGFLFFSLDPERINHVPICQT